MRDYNNPEYTKFRKAVKLRDGFKCRWPGCCAKKKLQVHHIMGWAAFPSLRFIVSNGITLCKKHHMAVKGKELDFALLFISIIRGDQ